jgi:hypothetical protein
MKSRLLARAALGITIGVTAVAASAQSWTPGSEILGQPIQVTTGGVSNTLYLDPGGSLRILTPGGNTVAGTWTAANGRLCIGNGAAQECVPYSGPFQAGTPMALTSSCGAAETWLASSTNAPPPSGERGERGR